MTTYAFGDGSSYTEEQESTPETVVEDLEEWIRDGSWGFDGIVRETMWIHASYKETSDPDSERQFVRVTLEPEEPSCSVDEGHNWEQTGLRGSSGGVLITETCSHCTWDRVTNTFAQDPGDGTQGHFHVSYREPDGILWGLREEEDY